MYQKITRQNKIHIVRKTQNFGPHNIDSSDMKQNVSRHFEQIQVCF